MHPVEAYLKDLHEIRSTGGAVPETSYYGALEKLLNEIGKKLKPRVRCVPTLLESGAGHPDFGLYSANQFQKAKDEKPIPGQPPERGVIEVKGTSDDSWLTAQGEQATKYWGHYGQILVTNYRDFVFIGKDENGNPLKLETYRMAESEAKFWALAAQPRKAAEAQGDRLIEYLRRVLLHSAPLDEPEQLAWYLASYAREAKARIEEKVELPGLSVLRSALEEALGLKFQGPEGERFFRATLVQTLFYGVFSSWVLWAREHPEDADPDAKFNWHEAAWNLKVPMIASLFDQIATPQQLKPLGLDEVLDWTGLVLNRVLRTRFFEKFEEQHAVQYFYEPFLQAYDPQLRKELGVWFTPPEIVKYQVARVHTVLQEELEIQDGLADPRVYVLDPCCGTGAYLVEVIHQIHETLAEKEKDALLAQKLKKAVIERVFGFEILPAPFVVSHLQIGLLLRNLGAPFSEDAKERAGVYLTNALTGWEPEEQPPKDRIPSQIEAFPELEQEKDAAEKIKRDTPILVILGNPPYNAFTGTSPEEEEGLVEPYKQGLNKPVKEGGWDIKKFNLDDLYVRFFRIAERRILKSGKGVISFISNYSWTSEPSFVVLRQHLLESFDKIWIENMHGNRNISEYAPDGRTSETIFAISGFSPGIRQGIVISLCVKSGKKKSKKASILYRDDLNEAKAGERRKKLLTSLTSREFDKLYQTSQPEQSNRYCFRPTEIESHYLSWPTVFDLAEFKPSLGILENRKDGLISIDLEPLEFRMGKYYDSSVGWEDLKLISVGLTSNAARFDAKNTRKKVLKSESFDLNRIKSLMVRPMDKRWCYYSLVRPLWNEPRPNYIEQSFPGNSFLVTRRKGVANPEGVPFSYNSIIGAQHGLNTDAYYIPIMLKQGVNENEKQMSLDGDKENNKVANLSKLARNYLKLLKMKNADSDIRVGNAIWMHSLAIGYSEKYQLENRDGIRQDWPRIPLPDSKKLLEASAALGRQMATLLDTEAGVSGVTTGKIRTELKDVAVVSRVGGSHLRPDDGELDLSAGWSHAGKGGICMPGRGKLMVRPYSKLEKETIEEGARGRGLSLPEALQRLGEDTRDIYLNEVAYWSNVPAQVWEYYIGGYQVIKKWLSYREKSMIGRSLKMEEVEYVTEMTRRLAAIILLGPELDRNYEAVKNSAYSWPADQ